ncbi:MAG: fused MFS/spermidine synthase [Planctomycetaceae bacterium]
MSLLRHLKTAFGFTSGQNSTSDAGTVASSQHLMPRRTMLAAGSVLIAVLGIALYQAAVASDRDAGSVVYEVKSTYSHIRIRRNGNVLTLVFVRDSGEEAFESQVNLKAPHVLKFNYLQHMFASYLVQPEQKNVMIVGLGGGSMVHFLQKYDPEVAIEAVEIDPIVVQLAEKYFKVKQNEKVKLIVADAFEHLKTTTSKYDTIYMDAFLKPSADTDETGVPLKLRTIEFYKQMQGLLTENGSVVYNINPHDQMEADIATIREAFPQTYVFNLPNRGGVVVVGSMQKTRVANPELISAGKSIDTRFKAGFSFQDIARRVRKN